MAVFPNLPGLHVQIHDTVDHDTPLPEYNIAEEVDVVATSTASLDADDEENEGPRRKRRCRHPRAQKAALVKYLQTGDASNMGFRLCFKFEQDAGDREFFSDDILALVYFDGEFVTDTIINKEELEADDETCIFMNGKLEQVGNSDQWTTRPFQFSKLLIDSESRENDKEERERFQPVGVIKVEMHRIESLVPEEAKIEKESNGLPVDVSKEVKEKSVKGRAVSHAISYSLQAAQPTNHHVLYCPKYIDGKEQPFATFIFHYRTLDNLKKLGIVERTPPPVPLEERDWHTLTGEEKEILALRHIVRRARLPFHPVAITESHSSTYRCTNKVVTGRVQQTVWNQLFELTA